MKHTTNSPLLLIIMYPLIFLLFSTTTLLPLIASQTIVKTLPGYPGPLPFKLETGYIGVGEDEVVQLFYLFVESEGNPEEDPLIVWLAGGPGCATLRSFFFQIGPMQIQYDKYLDGVPALELHPNSWTKVANVIYLDAPTLTGYSYTKTPEAIRSSDTLSAAQTAEFLRKFVRNHPKFLKNPMYVTGISYSGIVIPIITEELYKGNDEGLEPILNIKGYMAGNPLTDKKLDVNSRFEYAYRLALISKDLYESTRKACKGEYTANSNDEQCMSKISEVNKRVKGINTQQILEPDCDPATNLVTIFNPIRGGNRRSLRHIPYNDYSCRGYYHMYAIPWANDEKVMKALNIRNGTVKEWTLCNMDMEYHYGKQSMPSYEFDILSSVEYHEKLSKRNSRALIFSGDHDMMVSHVGTYNWINSLNLTITHSNWDAWYNKGQEAGYKTTYARDNYTLAFVTIRGAGHTGPEFKPRECFVMVERWFAHKPI